MTTTSAASAWPDFPGSELPPPEDRLRRASLRALGLLAVAVTLAYLVWRVVATTDGATPWLAWPLLALEAHALVSLGLHLHDLWDLDSRRPPQPVAADEDRWTVAVLVPTYDEPREVLLPTVAAAVALQPAHETWVLDDGDRPWVREMAADLGARYRSRRHGAGAKAGNVNEALDEVRADLVAVLDADHVARADLLLHLLGYFEDPRTALVQTPQDFYNLDSFEHVDRPRGRRYSEQELFYRALAAGRNRWGAAFWCGTGAVVRTSALRDVGGVATETVTEDIHTTIRLHRKGWRTAYHNEVLARGLAAADAGQYLAQRLRWGTGAMQVLRIENPAVVSGLDVHQRLSYMSTLLGWFDSWRTLGYLVLPLATLVSGGLPVVADAGVFVVAYGTTLLLQRLALVALARGRAPLWQSTRFDLVRLPANLAATTALLGRRAHAFAVTRKGRVDERRRQRSPRLLTGLLGASALALVWWALTTAGLTPATYALPWVAHASAGWALLNVVIVVDALRRIRSGDYAGERRAAVRFDLPGRLLLAGEPAELLDVSLTGARVTTSGPAVAPAPGQAVEVELPVPGAPLRLAAVVRGATPAGEGSGAQVRLEWQGISAAESAALALALFRTGSSPRLVGADDQGGGPAPSGALPAPRAGSDAAQQALA